MIDPQSHLAFVLLETAAVPSGEQLVAELRKIAPCAEADLVVESAADGSVLQFAVGDHGSLSIGLMPMPVPNREAEGAFAFSYSAGHDGNDELAPHRAHLVVFFRDEPGRSRYEGLTRFTYLVASVAQASNAKSIYWGDAGATHEAQFFIDVTRECDPDRMLPLWCGFEVVPEGSARVSMLTTGMRRQLGVMELRVTAPRRDLRDYVGTMFDFLAYAARRGSAVPEGDTVGRSADEHLKVRYEPSPVDPNLTVWRVDFP